MRICAELDLEFLWNIVHGMARFWTDRYGKNQIPILPQQLNSRQRLYPLAGVLFLIRTKPQTFWGS